MKTHYKNQGDWLACRYDDAPWFVTKYQVDGIPAAVAVNAKTGQVISYHGRGDVFKHQEKAAHVWCSGCQ